MKHPLPATIALLLLFLGAQLVGIMLVAKAIPVSVEDGRVVVGAPETALGPPPETNPWQTLLLLCIGVGVGTALILLLARFRKYNLWRVWFLLAAWMTMTISFGVLFGAAYYGLATALGFLLAVWKAWRPNPIIHNLTELFIYPGIAILFYHILNVPVMLVLMGAISLYDLFAVLHSKHMVSMAQFQTKSRVFAGLAVPRSIGARPDAPKKASPIKHVKKGNKASPIKHVKKGNTAILGGGDIAFPLLFAAVVLEGLIAGGMAKNIAMLQTAIIAVCSMLGLGLLFFVARKDKFYPAMPAVTVGCLIGWAIILII